MGDLRDAWGALQSRRFLIQRRLHYAWRCKMSVQNNCTSMKCLKTWRSLASDWASCGLMKMLWGTATSQSNCGVVYIWQGQTARKSGSETLIRYFHGCWNFWGDNIIVQLESQPLEWLPSGMEKLNWSSGWLAMVFRNLPSLHACGYRIVQPWKMCCGPQFPFLDPAIEAWSALMHVSRIHVEQRWRNNLSDQFSNCRHEYIIYSFHRLFIS